MRNRFLCIVAALCSMFPSIVQGAADIDVLTPDVCVPGKVELRIINCGSCASFEWQIGAGASFKAGADNYATIITDTGWYDVTVKIKTTGGLIFVVGKKKAFYGRQSPVPQLKISDVLICRSKDTITFTDLTPRIVSRDWLIEGTVFYKAPPVIKYKFTGAQGFKSVYLLVRDSWGCKGTLLKDSAVAYFDSVKTLISASKNAGCAPTNVDFSASYDTGFQKIRSVLWKFQGVNPDSSKSRQPKGIYYAKGDTFDLSLTLKTTIGCVYHYTINNIVSFGDSASIKITTPKSKFCVNEPFWVSSSGSKTNALVWNIGPAKNRIDTPMGTKIRVRFTDTGKAYIKVSENDRGCVSVATAAGVYEALGPKAFFTSEDDFYCSVPTTLKYTNGSVAWSGGTSYKWRIFDSAWNVKSTGTVTDFSYYTTKGARYNVELIATGTNGCSDTFTRIDASVYGFINSKFKVMPAPVCPGSKFSLISAVGKGTTAKPNYFLWTFYDLNHKPIATSSNAEPQYSYSSIGRYDAKLVIWNSNGCKDSLLQKDTVIVEAPAPKLNIPDTFVCINEPLVTYAQGKGKNKSLVAQWAIKNIDSAFDIVYGQADTFQFALRQTGRWKVTYTLTDTSSNGCSTVIVYPNVIRVSGVKFAIGSDINFGCAPLNVQYKATLISNVSYEKSGNSIFKWKKFPGAKVTFDDSTKQNPKAVLGKGQQQVRLVYQNASGCSDSANYISVNAGLDARFSIPGQARCVGKPLQLYNASSGWATAVEYFSNDPNVVFLTSKTIADPKITFKTAGNHTVGIIAKYNTSCRDTWELGITAYQVKANFYTPDSVSYCAPKLINFINTTNTPYLNFWKFGDGDTAKTFFADLAGHLYLKNNGNPGYDVQLIAQDFNGCSDTLLKKGYIRIIGPVPDFEIKQIQGCEPLKVQFFNKSKDFSRMFLDYDNGVVLDSNVLLSYPYRITDKALPVQKFFPRLLLYDSFGCSALATAKDTVVVLKNAEADYVFTSINFLRKTEGCANDLLVKFTNKSRFYVKTYWDFDNDNKNDLLNQNSATFFYAKPGVFKPRLVAENSNGCRDTFYRDSIVVWEPPVAAWKSSSDTTCAINPMLFVNRTTSKYPIASYHWNFGEAGVVNDTSTAFNTKWKYTAPFFHPVSLKVADSNGCKDEVIRNIFVNDTAGPVKPDLAFITVRNNQWVDFYWQKSRLGNYLTYHVFLDSLGLWQRYSSSIRSDTSLSFFRGNETSIRRFCYTLKVEDTCHQLGRDAVSHCTMVLRDTAFEPFNIQLNWLAYDWWDKDLSHYEIFRAVKGSSNFTKIADVKNTNQFYTDSFLCDSTYCYYVEAVHRNRIWRSRSNEVCRKPIYTFPDSMVHTSLVTVVNSAHAEVFWQPYYKYYRNWTYELQRSLSGTPGSFSKLFETKNLWYADLSARVNSQPVYYRVVFHDHCYSPAKPGVVSNSIYLGTRSQNRTNSSLVWNPYQYWHCGVQSYGVQLKDKSGNFQTIQTVGPTKTFVDSLNIEGFNLDSICFRVFAVKDSVTLDTSWSNEVCLVPASYVIVPTAFSPDQNGLNEVFKPSTAFIHRNSSDPVERYEFRVYNRWGQMVFETNDPSQGWDGYFANQLSQSGLYIWTVKALGYDGVPHRMNGTVYLVR